MEIDFRFLKYDLLKPAKLQVRTKIMRRRLRGSCPPVVRVWGKWQDVRTELSEKLSQLMEYEGCITAISPELYAAMTDKEHNEETLDVPDDGA